jgi:hypothetical protein
MRKTCFAVASLLWMILHSPPARAGEAFPAPVVFVTNFLQLSEDQTRALITMIQTRDAALQPLGLFLLAYLEPVLQQHDAGIDHRLFDSWSHREKLGALVGGAEAHHTFDTRAVVPAAIENHDLTGRRQVPHVSLPVHLGFFALGRRRQSDHAEDPRAHAFGDRLDHAALTGAIAAFVAAGGGLVVEAQVFDAASWSWVPDAALIGHSGSTAAYRAHLVRYPEQRVSVAVLCNASTAAATQLAHDVADIAMPGVFGPAPVPTPASTPAPRLTPSRAELEALAGTYVSDEAETTFVAAMADGVLVLRRRPDAVITLTPASTTDVFSSSLGTITFRRDAGRVVAFSVRQDRVWDLRFERR